MRLLRSLKLLAMTKNNVQDVNLRKLYCKRIGMSRGKTVYKSTGLPVGQSAGQIQNKDNLPVGIKCSDE